MDVDNPILLQCLSEVKNGAVRRRITRELTDIINDGDNNHLYLQSVYFDEKNKLCVTLVDCNQVNILIYDFHIDDNYPFHSPKINVNNKDYFKFLNIQTPEFRAILKKIHKLDCLCCNSYLCGDRWSPAIRLISIVNEIRVYRKYKRDIIHKFYTDKIKDLYLISDIDLFSWLF